MPLPASETRSSCFGSSSSFLCAQQRGDGSNVGDVFQLAHALDDGAGLGGGPLGKSGVVQELGGDFLETHGIGRAALGKIGSPRDGAAALQMNIENAGHFVVHR